MPDSASIVRRQVDAHGKRLQTAARHEYDKALLLRRLQVWPSFAFAGAGVLIAYLHPPLQNLLGAMAGAWLFLSRIVLSPMVDQQRLRGALALEEFDCYVLQLPWNKALGNPLAKEEIFQSSTRATFLGAWYPDVSQARWATAVLICQRSNVVWSRRQHAIYAILISLLGSAWLVAGIVLAVLRHAELGTYLIMVGLPSLPALLDAIETRNGNALTARRRQAMEPTLDQAITDSKTNEDPQLIRSIQDRIFAFRKESPLIPQIIYRRLRPSYNATMQAVAEAQISG